jgi:hypothetical protein
MDSRTMAENIATMLREQDDNIKALKTVLQQKLSMERFAALEREVQTYIAQERAGEPYQQSLAQVQRGIADAKDDTALISLLHSTLHPIKAGQD